MSSPREAELQSPLPGNGATLLSLQETPLGCSSRMPGNLQFFLGFLDMGQVIRPMYPFHSQGMHKTHSFTMF